MDPFAGLADFILGRLKQSATAAWLKFLFEMAFSLIVSFLFVCGGFLASGQRAGISIGLGMVAGAISVTVLFRRESRGLTKGMLVVLPQLEAAKELETDVQIVQKSEDTK